MRRSLLLVVVLAGCRVSEAGTEDDLGASSTDSTSNSETDSTSTSTDSTSTESDSTETETETETSDETETETTDDTGEPGESLGVFDLTYYWVTSEGDFFGDPDTDVGDCDGNTLATVPATFANALKLEGTGKLLDGRILNIGGCGCGGGFDCFAELDPNEFPWGQGSQSNPLIPFTTIATDTDVLAFGTSVYVPSLVGQALPDGSVHDGCLQAGDVGGGIDGMHIDWFVGLKANYETLDPDVPETVELFEGGTICD
jgi:hypothetical protein